MYSRQSPSINSAHPHLEFSAPWERLQNPFEVGRSVLSRHAQDGVVGADNTGLPGNSKDAEMGFESDKDNVSLFANLAACVTRLDSVFLI